MNQVVDPMKSAYAPPAVPNQAVYTPPCVIELIDEIWPDGIACDPFPGLTAPVSGLAKRLLDDGFAEPWPDCSYANPPFRHLKEAMHIARKCAGEVLLLGPAQTHREWFWTQGGDVKFWLRPIAFVGHKSTFPKPLVLHFYAPNKAAHAQVVQIGKRSGLVRHVSC